MISNKITFNIRYSETDQMGIVYHGNYAQYYEMGRVELLRELNLPYSKMEEGGLLMPVIYLESKYLKSAFYDETISLVTKISQEPSVKIHFEYELYNSKKELINTGKTSLVFLDKETRKPIRAPQHILEILKPYF